MSTQLLQKTFFDLASSVEHKLGQDNRKQLYALHAAFQAITGVPFVDGDGDLDDLEKAHEKSVRTAPKGKENDKGKERGRERGRRW